MSVETDGIEEVFEAQLRVLLTAAGQVGERLARAREEQQRRAQAGSEQETRELSSRIDAQRRTALAELGNVYRAEWWADASPQQISDTYQVARAWAGEEPDAARAQQHVLDEVRGRYGVDLTAGTDPAAVRAAVERIEQTQAPTRAAAAGAGAEHAETVLLLTQGAAAETAAERSRVAGRQTSAGSVPYDSPQRRNATAASLTADAGIDQAAVAMRMRADVSQGRPASHATATAPGAVPTARRTRGATQIQRSDPSR